MLHFRMDMPLYLMALYGSAMIIIVLLLRSLLRDRLPKFVFPLLWGLVLIRLLLPFSLSSPISAPVPEWQQQFSDNGFINTEAFTEGTATTAVSASESVAYTTESSSGTAESFDSLMGNWRTALAVIYGLGVAATAGVLQYQRLRYSRRLKNSLLVEHNQSINTILRDMGMGHVLVFTNDQVASPLVCGILHPKIYLPASLDFRNHQLLRHILAHETMHIKRRDNWLKAVMLLALCLHWYNPLVWLMSKCLASDLEAACDAAVLKQTGADERKSYAASLLSMAITGGRPALLYSAFSKTEVERRIQNVLSYKKTTALVLSVSVLFVLAGTVVFATGAQAPFSSYLSSYCSSDSSKWAVEAELARDISLGENAGRRADRAILEVLRMDTSHDPDIIAREVKAALAREFNVEKGAFRLAIDLFLTDEEITKEYAKEGITRGQDGFYVYNGEAVRTYQDEMLGSVQMREQGAVDIAVHRSRLGQITSVTVLREGDAEFDRRTKEMEWHHYETGSASNSPVVEQTTAVEEGSEAGSL